MRAALAAPMEAAFAKIRRVLNLPAPHEISLDQMNSVATATRMAMAGHAFNTVIVTLALLVNGLSASVVAWSAMSFGVAYYVAARARRNKPIRQTTPQHKKLSQRAVKKATIFGVLLALPWGVLPVLFFDPTHHAAAMVIMVLVAGMSASGAISLAPVYPAAFAYVLSVAVPACLVLIYHANVYEYMLLACITLCYTGFLFALIAIVARISIGASQKTAQLNHTLMRIDQATQNIDQARSGLNAWYRPNEMADSILPKENADIIVETLNKSARKMVRQGNALKRSEKQLSDVLNSAMDAIVSVNQHQAVLSTNAAAKDMFALHPGNNDNTTLDDLLREDSSRSVVSSLARLCKKRLEGENPFIDGALIEAVALKAGGQEFPIEISAAVDEDNGNATLIIRDVTERKSSEAQLRVLMKEVNHRSRNLMAVLNSIMSMTASRAKDTEEFITNFGNRLQCLLKSHDIIMRDDWSSSGITSLIESQLAATLPDFAERLQVSGPAVDLTPKSMQNLGLALHELATNSMKYGAFSVPGGIVKISWRAVRINDEDALQIVWSETGGPAAKKPTRKGFGTILLEQIFGADLDGRSALKYRPSGLAWQARIASAHYKMA